MTNSQEAAREVFSALKVCADAGFKGGVYDCKFCIWPKDALHPHEGPDDFFANVESVGGVIVDDTHGMNLDSGGGN